MPFWIVDLASLTFWMNVLMSHAGWLNYVLCVQWSLSIEEVFYLSFPILCLTLKRDRRLLLAWGVFILLGSVWRETHQADEYQQLNSYLSCFDGIAFGCCAAVLGNRVVLPAWSATPIQIVVAVAMAAFYMSAWIGDTAIYGVTLMAFGAAILLVMQAQSPPSASFAFIKPVRSCGRSSYELYLFHLVVLGGLRTVWPPEAMTGDSKTLLLAAYLIASIVIAGVLRMYFSEPLNRRLREGAVAPVRLREA